MAIQLAAGLMTPGTRYFCTYFDRNFLVRGLTLYRSLERHASPFVLYVLCLDDAAHRLLSGLALPNLRPVALEELEAHTPVLLAAKENRNRVEYYFTCTPAWPLFILDRFVEVDLITYVDADLFFYHSPEPIFEELGDDSVLIIGHRFPPHLRQLEIHGVYNVGLLAFRNDDAGRTCLTQWRDQCLDWCYDRLEDGKFADQKYLDVWPTELQGVHVLQHPGAGLAPWNWMGFRIGVNDDTATVDGQPLIFYHFHALKQVNRWLYDLGMFQFGLMPAHLRRWFYAGYINELRRTEKWIRERTPGFRGSSSTLRSHSRDLRLLLRKLVERHIMLFIGRVSV